MLHEPEMQRNPGDACPNRREPYALVRLDARRIAADRRDQQYALVQNAMVPQGMRQGERDARASRREDRSASRQAEGPALAHPFDAPVLAPPRLGAAVAQQPAPR